MSDNIKNWLYILGTILVIGMVGVLAFKILWFLLPIIIILYIIFKVKGYFERKNKTSSSVNYTSEYKSYYTNEDIDDSVGKVIDVDYEDVNK